MVDQNQLKLGEYNAVCDICGWKYKASELRESGDLGKKGLMVCKDCYDPLHMQDLLRGRADNPSVPWARPDNSGDDSTGTNVDGDTITTSLTVETHGDVDYTTAITDNNTHIYDTALTANREIQVTTGAAYKDNDRIQVYRTAGGAFTLTVSTDATPMYVIPASVNGVVKLKYKNSTWLFEDFYTVGL